MDYFIANSKRSNKAYIDHSVLNAIDKKLPKGRESLDFINSNNLTPVFSNATLQEIANSKKRGDNFRKFLETYKAEYIHWDNNTKQYDFFKLPFSKIEEIYQEGNNNVLAQREKDFYDIFYTASAEYKSGCDKKDESKIKKSLQILDACKHIIGIHKKTGWMPNKEILIEFINLYIAKCEKDKSIIYSMDEFDTPWGNLKNIKPPSVLEQILNKTAYSAEQFGISYNQPKDHNLQAIMDQFNCIGFYRDKKLSIPTKVKNSALDTDHAVFASNCGYFLVLDKGLYKKAYAAYECLEIDTTLLPHIKGWV